jgi:hypothetical protein
MPLKMAIIRTKISGGGAKVSKITSSFVMMAAIGSCSATQYRHYGLDISTIPVEDAQGIVLKSGGVYPDLDGRDCWTPENTSPRCIVLEDSEWLSVIQTQEDLQQRLEHCEGGE